MSVGEGEITSAGNTTNPRSTLPPFYSPREGTEQLENLSTDELPSHRFRYSVWHDLRDMKVKGPELKAPRVRNGPPEKEQYFYKVRDNDKKIHHSLKGNARKNYRNATEDWENATAANLSFQELGQKYQRDNFLRVLKRLIRVEDLNLHHNGIVDLKSVNLPRCRRLVVSKNYLDSAARLPRLPAIEELDLTFNGIANMDGFERLRKTPLKSLTLALNPITFTLNYRQRVFAALPNLQCLDGIGKLPEDAVWEDDPAIASPSSCVVS